MVHLHGYTGYFQLYNMPFHLLRYFDYSEKRSLFEPGGINSGAPTIFDALREHKVPHVLGNNWMKSESANIAKVRDSIAQGKVTFAYLFLGKLDALLHEHGTDAPSVKDHLKWYETQLHEILDVARNHYEDTRLFVFADHGMTETKDTCDVRRLVEGLGFDFGTDYAAVYDSTVARFWFFNDAVRESITQALESEALGHIMSDSELETYGCDFPGAKYGELFFLMNPGVLLCPSFMGEKSLRGMHGYAPEHPDSAASFMTNATDVAVPRRLDDLYGLMRSEALGDRNNAP